MTKCGLANKPSHQGTWLLTWKANKEEPREQNCNKQAKEIDRCEGKTVQPSQTIIDPAFAAKIVTQSL